MYKKILCILNLFFYLNVICSHDQTCAERFEAQLGNGAISWEQFFENIIQKKDFVHIQFVKNKQGMLRFTFQDKSYTETLFFTQEELSKMNLSDGFYSKWICKRLQGFQSAFS